MNEKFRMYGLFTLVTGIILYFAFFEVLQNPEHWLFSAGGDGLKNYFTFVDYVKHGHGTHFTGMNYPYGEHVIFTDNQPALALFFHWVNHDLFNIENNLIGIYNVLLIVSIFLSGLFILKILKFFKLPDWYAITFSILIMFLSPQLRRIWGHFTLSYAFFIPAIWYYLLRIFDKNAKFIHYFGLAFIFLFSTFIHLYFFAMNMMIVLIFSLIALGYFKRVIWRKTIYVVGLATIMAIGVIAFIKLTDTITDRPIQPFGIDFYSASFESIFLPNTGFIDDLLEIGNQQGEGLAYVGAVGLLFAVISIFYFLFKFLSNTRKAKHPFFEHQTARDKLLTISLLTGIITALYASHFFHYIDIFGITKHLGSFGQFRSIGRFAWIFYYTYTVFCAYYIYRFFDQKLKAGKQTMAFVLLLFVVVVWNNEARQNFNASVKHIFNHNTLLMDTEMAYANILKDAGKTSEDFQAILQIPLYIVGPEKWGVDKGARIIKETFSCSFQTELPIMDIVMSRSSLSHSLDLAQLLGLMPIEHVRLKEMDDRPILMLYDTSLVRLSEKHLLAKGKFLGIKGNIKLLELPIDSVKSNIKMLSQKYYRERKLSDSIYLDGDQGYYFVENFEQEKSKHSFNDNGAKYFKDEIITCNQIPKDSLLYEISFWLYFDPLEAETPIIYNEFLDGEHVNKEKRSLDDIVDVKDYWVRVTTIVDSGKKYCMKIEGEAYIDAILVRPVNSHLIQRKSGTVFYDNCPIPHK